MNIKIVIFNRAKPDHNLQLKTIGKLIHVCINNVLKNCIQIALLHKQMVFVSFSNNIGENRQCNGLSWSS